MHAQVGLVNFQHLEQCGFGYFLVVEEVEQGVDIEIIAAG